MSGQGAAARKCHTTGSISTTKITKDDAKKYHNIDSFFTNSKSAGQSTSTQSVTEPELSELDHSDYVEPDVHEISPPKKKNSVAV